METTPHSPTKRRGPIGLVLSVVRGNQTDAGFLIVSIGGVIFLLMCVIVSLLAISEFLSWYS